MSTPRLLLCAGLCLVLVTGVVVYRDLTQLRRQHGRADALSRGEVPLDSVPAAPSPFLEDQPLTGAPEHALLVEGATAGPALDLLGSDDSKSDFLSGEAPPELPHAAEVEPVPLLTPDRRKKNTAAIKDVLPDISDEQLEFWLEETRDLPPEMIRDMLTLRKRFGALAEPSRSDQNSQPLTAGKPKADRPDPVRESLLRARALLLQNRMNANSIGYLATKLVFVEDASTIPSGVRLSETRLSLTPGRWEPTYRPLDTAFNDATTFLVVQHGETKFLTRFGRLVIGPDRRLRLAIEGTDLIVSPGIEIPAGNEDVWIASNGDVFVWNPNSKNSEPTEQTPLGRVELKTVPHAAYLQPAGTACYLPTKRSGQFIDLPEDAASEALKPQYLQGSNVDPQENGWTRERIDDMLKIWEEQKPLLRKTPVPAMQSKSWSGFRLDIF